MKKLLLLLLFIPLISFSQVIVDKKLGEIDISTFSDKYITITLNQILPASHLLSTSEYKEIVMRTTNKKKKWNVYDNGVLIRLKDKIDVLNFFSKYGYELATSDTESYGVVSGSVIIPVGTTSLTLMKVKQ
jgi:hypothetical protein|tara:strand:- start:1065 stop:1457 length:393 start_codon:yes stop_codon:yes gene_type:complete